MQHYEASVVYDPDSLRRMAKIQIRSRVVHNAVYLTMCVILIISGIRFGVGTMPGLMCIAAGGLGIPLMGAVIRTRTENILKALGGSTIHVRYSFDHMRITVSTGDQTNSFRYGDLIKLWEDSEYFYLFYGKIDVLMISKKSLVPDDLPAFRKELSEVTGKTWYQCSLPPVFSILPFAQKLLKDLSEKGSGT